MIKKFSILFLLGLWFPNSLHSQADSIVFSFPENTDKIELPFRIVSNKIYFKAEVNGILSNNIILDTGNPMMIISSQYGQKLNLTQKDKFPIGGVGKNPLMAAFNNEKLEIDINGLKIKNVPSISTNIDSVIAPYEGNRVDGVFGGPIFKNTVVKISYEKNQLTIYKKDAFDFSTIATNPIGLDLTSGHPVAIGKIIIKGKAFDARLTMDTGVRLPVLLHGHFVRKNNLSYNAFGKHFEALVGCGIGGEIINQVARVDKILIGDYTFSEPWITIGEIPDSVPENIKDDGIIGYPILSNYEVIYDYPRSRMFLVGKEEVSKYVYNRAGIFLKTPKSNTNEIIIADVIAESPASKAGLQKGDRLLMVNEKLTSNFKNLDEIRTVFLDKVGSKVKLKVSRNGKQLATTLILRKLI